MQNTAVRNPFGGSNRGVLLKMNVFSYKMDAMGTKITRPRRFTAVKTPR